MLMTTKSTAVVPLPRSAFTTLAFVFVLLVASAIARVENHGGGKTGLQRDEHPRELGVASEAAGLKGANYGNRFIVEDWLASQPYEFYEGVPKHGDDRLSLCDMVPVDGYPHPRDRMLAWLNATIQPEQHFAWLRDRGFNLVRVPTGYWNWITYAGDLTPAAPSDVAARLRNLQNLGTPSDFEPYLTRIMKAGAANGIKVLLDLHGAPGSQNGEMHSGCSTGATYYFEDSTKW